MLKVGAHVSIAGGFSKVVGREAGIGGNCGQIFVHSPRSWSFPKVDEAELAAFRQERARTGIGPFVVHSCYLVNIGTANDRLFRTSVSIIKKEVELAGKLGIEYYSFHPGSHTGAGREKGMAQIVKGLKGIRSTAERSGVKVLLENTSGKGDTLGKTMAELGEMIGGAGYDIGVCFDTCHGFTSGYPVHTAEGLNRTVAEIGDVIGMKNLCAIHLNDSAGGFGSNVDRHEHIGLGAIGKEAMRRIVNHPALRLKPFILETPVDPRGDFMSNMDVVKSLYKE